MAAAHEACGDQARGQRAGVDFAREARRAGAQSERLRAVWRGLLPVVVFSVLVTPLVLPSVFSAQDEPGPLLAFSVKGYLSAQPHLAKDDPPAPAAIEVPGASVRLESMIPGTHAETGRTDLSGRFAFFGQAPGEYRICWEVRGFADGCSAAFAVTHDVHLDPFALEVEGGRGLVSFYGRVRFGDRSLPRALDSLGGVNAFAVVRAKDARGRLVAPPVHVDNSGEYLLPAVPVTRIVMLEAAIEGARARYRVARTRQADDGVRRVDLTLGNRPPTSGGIVAAAPLGRRWTARPGETVRLRVFARDQNGDPLTYRWIAPAGVAEASAPTRNVVAYRLPESVGEFEFAVVVGDGKGGYVRDAVTIATGDVRFAGTIAGSDVPAVEGADVEVNGKHTESDGTGRFELFVPEAPRYVLTIRHAGYGLLSEIYDVGFTGGRWTLTPASVTSADPTAPIDAVNQRRPGDCPGSLTDQARRRGAPPGRPCGPGIRVRIPADSLVDAKGNPPDGAVEVALTTIDLRAPTALPGDRTATRVGGGSSASASLGAGSVNVTRGGVSYNLAPGKRAQLIVPIAPGVRAPPTSTPLLRYDEANGRWEQVGTARRAGRAYRATVSHLSTFSASALASGGACLRLETTLMPQFFLLETVYPFTIVGPGPVRGVEISESFFVSDNGRQRFHVLYNLPLNTDIRISAFHLISLAGTVPEPIPLVVPGAAPGTIVSAPQITLNTGPQPQNPALPNPPAYPYQACRRSVELSPAIIKGAPPDPLRNTFFYGLYSFAAVNLDELDQVDRTTFDQLTEKYYKTIDPLAERETLDEFKQKNGFVSPTIGFRAQYANSGDLGFGRDMHCRSQTSGYACYVTNYGDRFTDDTTDAIDARIAYQEELAGVPPQARTRKPVATVAMEFTPIDGGTSYHVVKFYAYNNQGRRDDGNPTRPFHANLDGFGARPLPALCMVCHGGQYNSDYNSKRTIDARLPVFDPADPSTGDLDARFIPFDLRSSTLPVANVPGVGLVDFKADQQATFKALNEQIVAPTLARVAFAPGVPFFTDVAQAREVVQQMYAGGSPTQVEHFVTSGWKPPPALPIPIPIAIALYDLTVAPSCRSCHLSLAPRTASPSISWERADDFASRISQIEQLVCRQHKMPHAIVTHNRFWLSRNPYQPALIDDASTFLSRPRACSS